MTENTQEGKITSVLESNFMPYAMSVIVSRSIPEIDGLKPSHRKLLYTMYKMGLLTGNRSKSANVVGQTMKLNPHGDMAIYETLVRLSRGNESLLHPFIDSKGNFGKVYSKDMAYAASRYTECKLDPICAEFFKDIDLDTVDFVDNYDGTMKEPTLFPATYPSILVTANMGIAVGMASNICSFNLREICETTIGLIKDPGHDIMSTLKAPDFPTGGNLIYNRDALKEIYDTGRGSVKIRAKWEYIKKTGCIEITEIPYTTTVEAIKDKIVEYVKAGRFKEISDIRDETDKGGLKLTIDIKRAADPEKLMTQLFKTTTLEDSFSANFNILIAGTPRVMGIAEILSEWTSWRTECLARRLYSEMNVMKDRLHLLKGLEKILLDIDKAIKIIRETEEESEVIPNLMIGFRIDEIQANYIADIRLRNINREYIIKRTSETEELIKKIDAIEKTLKDKKKIQKLIIDELEGVAKKYGKERRTTLIYDSEIKEYEPEDDIENYPVKLFFTKAGYFKKITPLSLRMGGEHKLKEGDSIRQSIDAENRDELLIFTDKAQVYKIQVSDYEDMKASILGEYLPVSLGMEPDEMPLTAVVAGDYKSNMIFVFENGKASRVSASAYMTKTNRRKLTNAYSDKSPVVAILNFKEECEIAVYSDSGKTLVFKSSLLAEKATRDTAGVIIMTLKTKYKIIAAALLPDTPIKDAGRYRARSLPAAGALLRDTDTGNDTLIDP